MNNTVVKLGSGKVAISGGLQIPDGDTVVGILFLEPELGSGEIGVSVPLRGKDMLVFPDQIAGTILEFTDPRSIDVVIEQLATLRCNWNRVLSDPLYKQKLLVKLAEVA